MPKRDEFAGPGSSAVIDIDGEGDATEEEKKEEQDVAAMEVEAEESKEEEDEGDEDGDGGKKKGGKKKGSKKAKKPAQPKAPKKEPKKAKTPKKKGEEGKEGEGPKTEEEARVDAVELAKRYVLQWLLGSVAGSCGSDLVSKKKEEVGYTNNTALARQPCYPARITCHPARTTLQTPPLNPRCVSPRRSVTFACPADAPGNTANLNYPNNTAYAILARRLELASDVGPPP
jgi:hypothetical protein